MLACSLALVSILVAGAEDATLSPEDAASIERACAAALGPGECVLAQEPPSGPHALVRLGSREVTVEWLDGRGESVERTLRFSRDEAREEKAVAAGLLVAALSASEEARATEPESAVEPAPPSPAPPRVPPPTVETRLTRLEVGAAVLVGSDFASATFGGEVRVWVPFPGSRLGLLGAFGYHEPLTKALSVETLHGSLGLFVRSGGERPSGVVADVFVEALGEFAEARVARGGAVETRGFERFGARVGTAFGFRLGAFVPYVGLEGRWLAPRVVVRVGGDELTASQEFSGGLSLGARFGVF